MRLRLSAWLVSWLVLIGGTATGCDPGGIPAGADASADPIDATAVGALADAREPGGPVIDAAAASPPDGAVLTPRARVIAYLPNYSGSYGDWARRIDFTRMTHLNLAFATPDGNNDWSMGASDADVRALVGAAHAAGTKVLASLGGGGGDQRVIARYRTASNIPPLVAKLQAFVVAHDLDGVDIDIEDPNNLGDHYSQFVNATVAALRPRGKLVTAAVAPYLQDAMADATLHAFDFVNVMIYTTYDDSVEQLGYYVRDKHVPKGQLTLGAAFFGTDSTGREYPYAEILRADGNAWKYDQTTVGGRAVRYTGVASMKRLAGYSKGFGGIMFWELSHDTRDEHSLYKAIRDAM